MLPSIATPLDRHTRVFLCCLALPPPLSTPCAHTCWSTRQEAGAELSPKVWAAAFKAGADAVSKYGGAKRGSRTMLDALLPAADAAAQAAQSGARGHIGVIRRSLSCSTDVMPLRLVALHPLSRNLCTAETFPLVHTIHTPQRIAQPFISPL